MFVEGMYSGAVPLNGGYRIGEFARRVGVTPELLRTWEQRYGLLRPVRTAGGFRL
jgi:DNA-binding transcriptional MerR regulator